MMNIKQYYISNSKRLHGLFTRFFHPFIINDSRVTRNDNRLLISIVKITTRVVFLFRQKIFHSITYSSFRYRMKNKTEKDRKKTPSNRYAALQSTPTQRNPNLYKYSFLWSNSTKESICHRYTSSYCNNNNYKSQAPNWNM